MPLFRFSSNVTPRIFLVTLLLPLPASFEAPGRPASGCRRAQVLADEPPGGLEPFRDQLLAGEGDPRLAHGLELAHEVVEAGDRVRGPALEARADQPRDRDLVELRQVGLAVGGAIEREGLADRRHRAQPLRPDYLVDEDEVILLDDGEVDGFAELVRKPHQERTRERDEVGARGGREPQDGRAEADAAARRRRDQELLRRQRGDDALHGRARERNALRDLAEAQARGLLLERAQDRRRPRDDLDLALVPASVPAPVAGPLDPLPHRDLRARTGNAHGPANKVAGWLTC